MLLDANLSSSYWAKGSVNSSIPKELLLYKSNTKEDPYEAWHGKKPRVDTFKCLGVTLTPMFPKMIEENFT